MQGPKYPPGTPEYEAYAAELRAELAKFASGAAPYEYPVTQTTRITPNGSTTIVVQAPRPCGLAGCVAEVLFGRGSTLPTRVHLNAQQRRELVAALGGEMSRPGRLPADALPDADERARQRGLGR